MTIAIIGGANGQLANSLRHLNDNRFRFFGRPDIDLTNFQTFKTIFEHEKPNLVINAAAWTAVDAAETAQKEAFLVNRDASLELAKICAVQDIPFVHISTDYVFDGENEEPYREDEPISPQTVYGKSKAEGEKAILSAHDKVIILRTAWVYSAYGKNFVKSMLHLGQQHSQLKVVNDQQGNPTCSDDLAVGIQSLSDQLLSQPWQKQWTGIYHAVGTGDATWYELACYVLKQAEKYNQTMPHMIPISTEEWPTPAKRPKNSRLNTDKLNKLFKIQFPHWHKSVEKVVSQLLK